MAEITLIVMGCVLSVLLPVTFYQVGYVRGQLSIMDTVLKTMETMPDGRLHCTGGSYKPHEMQPTESLRKTEEEYVVGGYI